GEDLGDEAIKNIGKLNQTFKVGEATGKGLEAQMLSTGSAINALGQASTAQESYLVDFATRMAGVNTQAKVNVQDTLGYAAALDQLGQRSETASTALSQFTLKAFKETATYAKIAGMSTKEFSELLNRDANEALLRTLEGLNGNNEGLARMTTLFGDMGQEGARAVSTLASLASNTKLVRDQQAIANKEFASATSITNEFNAKNNTLAANLEIIGKRMMGAFVSSGVVDAINGIARGIADWLKQPVDAELQKQRSSINALVFETMRLSEGDERRIANIQQIKKEYPQFAAYLDAERATNADLAVVLDRVNAAYVKKILLARAQEDIADIQDRQAEAVEDEGDALERMNAIRTSAMLQMNADQKQRFAESYELIAGHFNKLQQAESSEVARNMRFNTWMQKNGMPATLYDEMRKLVNAEGTYKSTLDRRLAIDAEFQQKMDRINRLAAMAGDAEATPASERPT
ncbi:MAG TPA: phage tail tape measure protein, partial [Flavobacteriales bacterium]|nr:phage tail tape measure protein [Flavobacteriales bacterium]